MASTNLHVAFDRIDEFLAVQIGSGGAITVDAVNRLQEAVDILDDERVLIRDRLAALQAVGHRTEVASVLLGILIGRFSAVL